MAQILFLYYELDKTTGWHFEKITQRKHETQVTVDQVYVLSEGMYLLRSLQKKHCLRASFWLS